MNSRFKINFFLKVSVTDGFGRSRDGESTTFHFLSRDCSYPVTVVRPVYVSVVMGTGHRWGPCLWRPGGWLWVEPIGVTKGLGQDQTPTRTHRTLLQFWGSSCGLRPLVLPVGPLLWDPSHLYPSYFTCTRECVEVNLKNWVSLLNRKRWALIYNCKYTNTYNLYLWSVNCHYKFVWSLCKPKKRQTKKFIPISSFFLKRLRKEVSGRDI